MAAKEKLEAYFQKSGPFKEGIGKLRRIALKCGLEETLKWNAPVYTMEGKNVVGILSFKNHYGLWFFNGVFHSDPLGVLQNAQEGKTRAMRHWKFKIDDPLNPEAVKKYIEEAIQIEKKGLKITRKKTVKSEIPAELKALLLADPLCRANSITFLLINKMTIVNTSQRPNEKKPGKEGCKKSYP